MRKNRIGGLFCLGCLFPVFRLAVIVAATAVGIRSAHGVLMTYQFSGHIDTVDDPFQDWAGLVTPGDVFSGSYTYDPAAPDAYPNDPSVGIYRSADSSFLVNIGNWTGGTSGQGCQIGIYNWTGWGSEFVIGAIGFQSTGMSISEMTVGLSRIDGSAFESDALPTTAPSFDLFPSRGFGFQATNAVRIEGTLESLVLIPEPASFLLLLLAGSLIARRFRSCRRRRF